MLNFLSVSAVNHTGCIQITSNALLSVGMAPMSAQFSKKALAMLSCLPVSFATQGNLSGCLYCRFILKPLLNFFRCVLLVCCLVLALVHIHNQESPPPALFSQGFPPHSLLLEALFLSPLGRKLGFIRVLAFCTTVLFHETGADLGTKR